MIYLLHVILIVFLFAYVFSLLAIGFFMYYSWQKIFGVIRVPDCFAQFDLNDMCITTDDDIKIHGWFLRNPDNETGKAIILVHGFNLTRMSLIEEACLFLEEGYHVLMYDQRSHGKSSLARFTHGYAESSDFVAVLSYLREQPEIDASKIVVMAVSSGASTVIHAIADYPEARHLNAVVFEGAWSRTHDIPHFYMRKRMRLPYLLDQLIYIFVLVPAALLYWRGRMPHGAPIEVVNRIGELPILLIWGEDDAIVPPSAMTELYEALPSSTELWHISSCSHNEALQTDRETFRQRVCGFFDLYLTHPELNISTNNK